MSNETNEVINPINDTETTENQDVDINLDEEIDDNGDDKDKIIATLKAQKDHWKKKATTPKEEKKVAKAEEKKDTNTNLSMRDYLALAKADISADDIEEVQEYASLKKVSISEAMNAPVIKAILREKAEQRKASEATNTGTAKRSVSRVTDEQLVERAKKGEMPESEDDMIRLIKARKGLK